MNNGYQILHEDNAIMEVWAGGPCIDTGQFCPVFSIRFKDGTGFQTRGQSSGPDIRKNPEQRKKAKSDAVDEAIRHARSIIKNDGISLNEKIT
jgi:hypothetical protein